jgi:hypothetical protein
VKAPWFPQKLIEVPKNFRVRLGDSVAYQLVVAGPTVPVNHALPQGRFRNARNYRRLGKQRVARRVDDTPGSVITACRIFDWHCLLTGHLTVDLDSTLARKNVRNFTVYEAATIEFGQYVHGQPQFPPGWLNLPCIGYSPHEVATQHHKALHPLLDDRLTCFRSVQSSFPRWLKAILLRQLVQRYKLALFRDADSPLTLNVGMTLDGADTSAGPSYISSQQQQVHEQLNVLYAFPVLG